MKVMPIAAVAGVVLVAGGAVVVEQLRNARVSGAPTYDAGAMATPVAVTERSVTLRVDGMWCPSCPYIVRRALEKTPGVMKASVSFRNRSAVVTYDGGKSEVAALIAATTGMGYPSRVAGE